MLKWHVSLKKVSQNATKPDRSGNVLKTRSNIKDYKIMSEWKILVRNEFKNKQLQLQ